MNNPYQTIQYAPYTVEPFEDRIDILFRELELAIKWRRPSILLAVYSSEYVLADAEAALKNKLIGLGQSIHHLIIENEENSDVPHMLSEAADQDKTVFFVEGMRWGGEKDGINAYRTLNIRREYFIENQVRVVLWLTENEAVDLAHYAPDYWAIRHRVIEFIDSPKPEQVSLRALESTWQGVGECTDTTEDTDAKIALRDAMLADLPEGDESTATRANLLLTLGILHWRKGDSEKAAEYLQFALDLAKKIEDKWFEALCLNASALVKMDLGRIDEAVEAYQQAIELAPDQVFPWNNLGNLYSKLERNDEALDAFLKAIEHNPEDAVSWNGIGDVYHKLGRTEDSIAAYKKAIDLAPNFANPWNGLGNVYAAEKRIEEAIAAYQKATEIDQRIIQSWISLGNIFEKQGRSDEALKAYQKAFELDSRNATVWNELGNLHFNACAYDEALNAYEAAIELDNGLERSYNNLASIYFNRGKYAEAIPLYLKSIEFINGDKEKAILWDKLGYAYRRVNDYDNAVAAYQQADELDPSGLSCRDGLGETQNDLNRHDGVAAANDIDETTTTSCVNDADNPDLENAPLHNDLSEIQFGLGHSITANETETIVGADHQQADEFEPEHGSSRDDLDHPADVVTADKVDDDILADQQAGKSESDNASFPRDSPHNEDVLSTDLPGGDESPVMQANSLLTLGILHWRKGDFEKAAEFLQTARGLAAEIRDNCLEAVCLNAIALVETDTGRIDEAVETYKRTVELVPDKTFPWNNLGNLYSRLERNEEALDAFLKATELNSEDSVSWNGLGNVYYKLERTEDAVAAYQKAIELAPNFANPWNGMGNVYTNTGQIEDAIAAYQKAAESDQSIIYPWINLESTFEKQGRNEDAIKEYQKAFELDNKDAHVLNELGNVYIKAGAYDDAMNAYEKATQLDPEFGWPFSNLALTYTHKGQYADAIPLYLKSIEIFSDKRDKAITWNRLGNAYRRLNDYDSAIAAYQQAVELDPDNVSLLTRTRFSLLGNLRNGRNTQTLEEGVRVK